MNSQLFNQNFILILIGQLISQMGNGIQRFALSLYILDITGSARNFSILLSLQILPIILLSPFGGAIADRFNKGRLMVGLDFTAAVGLFGFVLFFDTISAQIIAISFMMIFLAIVNSLYEPAVRASVPIVSCKKNLNKANGLVSQVGAITNLSAPIAAGFVYGFLGIRTILIINLISYTIAGILEIFLRIPHKNTNSDQASLKIFFVDIKESACFLFQKRRVILYIILIASATNLFLSPVYTVGVPYMIKIIFGASDQCYGCAEAITGVGMVLGALLVGPLSKVLPFEKIHLLFSCLAMTVVGMGLSIFLIDLNAFVLSRISFVIYIFSEFMFALLIANINIQAMSFIQLQVPEAILGKTVAFTIALSTALLPLGQVIFGFLYDHSEKFLLLIYLVVTLITLLCTRLIKHLLKRPIYYFT